MYGLNCDPVVHDFNRWSAREDAAADYADELERVKQRLLLEEDWDTDDPDFETVLEQSAKSVLDKRIADENREWTAYLLELKSEMYDYWS